MFPRQRREVWTHALENEIRQRDIQIDRLRMALRQHAVHEEFDYPGDAPVSCGMFCRICHQHVDDDRIGGHAKTCLLFVAEQKDTLL